MKQKVKVIIVIAIIILSSQIAFTYSKASEDITKPYIEITEDMSKYETEKIINLTIEIKNMTEKVSYIDAYIEYDKNIFEEVKTSNFTYDELDEDKLNYFSYSSKANKIVIEFDDDVEVKTICKLKLKVLDTVTEIEGTDFKFNYASCYSYEEDKTIEFDNVTKTIKTKEEEPEPEPEKLYLSSETYKIGDNDIKNYEDGDKYISRVNKETTKQSFISNLDTNGTIRILKQNGTVLGENELIGTGMTLEVTKDEEKIELKIAVMGDLNGDGKVTATDLSTLNQTILKLVTLENEYKIAADLDENNSLTATDLSTINKMLLKIL